MDPGCLCKHICPDQRLIYRYPDAAEGLHDLAGPGDLEFVYIGLSIYVVVQNPDNARKRRITCSFPESVHCRMNSLNAGSHCRVYVSNSKIIIVMGMKIEMRPLVPVSHPFAEIVCLVRI